MKRQQCLDCPSMIRDPGGHGRCPLYIPPTGPRAGEAQTRMIRTEVGDRPAQIQAVPQGRGTARQRSAATGQGRQALTERRVQPLKVGRVEHPVALRAMPERLDACWRAIHDAAFDVDAAPLGVALPDLGDADVAPRAQPGTPVCSCPDWIATGLAHSPDLGAQPLGTEQERALERTGTHTLAQPPDPRHVAMLAALASQPHPRGAHQGQCHPHDAPLFVDAYLLRLPLPEGTRALDHMCRDRLALHTRPLQPRGTCPLIHAASANDGLQGAPMRPQGHDWGHGLRRSPQTIQRRAFGGGEGLAALGTDAPFLLTRVDATGALAGVASGRTRQIGAEYGRGVHDPPPPGFAWQHAKKSMAGPPFLLQANLTTL